MLIRTRGHQTPRSSFSTLIQSQLPKQKPRSGAILDCQSSLTSPDTLPSMSQEPIHQKSREHLQCSPQSPPSHPPARLERLWQPLPTTCTVQTTPGPSGWGRAPKFSTDPTTGSTASTQGSFQPTTGLQELGEGGLSALGVPFCWQPPPPASCQGCCHPPRVTPRS